MDDEIGAGRESSDDLTPYQRTFDVIEADKHELLVVAERNGEVIGTLQLSLLLGLSRRGAFRAPVLREGRIHGNARRAQADATIDQPVATCRTKLASV
ncbi:MAG: hypothetical protein ACRDRD_14810 [Pseudonocardiaceae bacterium]